MNFLKTDTKERIDDMRKASEKIEADITQARTMYNSGLRTGACGKLVNALVTLEETVRKLDASKNLRRNRRNPNYRAATRSLQISVLNLGDAREEMEDCENLAPAY